MVPWFPGGRLNAATLCSHRHATGSMARKTAVVYEGDGGQRRTLTFAELDAEVRRCAANLTGLGISRGDQVVLFVPVVPEAVVLRDDGVDHDDLVATAVHHVGRSFAPALHVVKTLPKTKNGKSCGAPSGPVTWTSGKGTCRHWTPRHPSTTFRSGPSREKENDHGRRTRPGAQIHACGAVVRDHRPRARTSHRGPVVHSAPRRPRRPGDQDRTARFR